MVIGDDTPQYIGDYNNPIEESRKKPTVYWNEGGILNTAQMVMLPARLPALWSTPGDYKKMGVADHDSPSFTDFCQPGFSVIRAWEYLPIFDEQHYF